MPAAAAMLANGTVEIGLTSMPQKLQASESFDSDEECAVFGVLLAEDRRATDGINCNRLVLGSIVVVDAYVRRRHCNELRQILHTQFPTLNGNFVFLSRDGWPILRNQENAVRACQVINERNAIEIQRNFGIDKCRLAVINQSAQVLGFIFCDLHATLQQVREAISEQLKAVHSLCCGYQFTERNAWPVQQSQESQMVLSDILANDSICVATSQQTSLVTRNNPSRHSEGRPASNASETSTVTFAEPQEDTVDTVRIRPSTATPVKSRNRNTIKNLIWRTGDKSQTRNNSSSAQEDLNCEYQTKYGLVAKPILISYVRAEAANHAISLKEELKKQGFSVYLDVHEIRTGNDWQDALNYAVSNCTVFVPLITPQYGMTQWTNREVKLADVLSKFIIPINFLDRWPPACLAIQFASTQYICWKSNLEAKSVCDREPSDYREWDHRYVVQVAQDICERFKLMFNNQDKIRELRHTVKVKNPKVRQDKVSSAYALDNALCSITEEGGGAGDNVQNKLVVISAHPKDLIFTDQAKRFLTEKGFTVWSSIEVLEEYGEGDVFVSGASLSTIPEGEPYSPTAKVSFARADTEVAPEKRGLCRLSSQISSIGAMTESLSPEKIERLTAFQKKVNQAEVVIVLLSNAYTNSSTSLQQIFYCEHRKKVVLIRTDDRPVPSIFSMLIGNDMLTTVDNPNILENVLSKVKRCFNQKTPHASQDDVNEAKMQYLVNFMKKNVPEFGHCVYIAGSSKLQSKRSEEICNAIGQTLAKNSDVNVVTGGFYGAGDIVARAFEGQRLLDMSSTYAKFPVVHILPYTDSKDFSQKASQTDTGDFEPVSYGKTFFVGDSVKERESAVARLFDICIVIEGGPGAAHEVEEFIWNDHFVIPIISSGGAASGQFGAPLKILETPPFVSKTDWSVLSEKEASSELVAEAVSNIVKSLKKAVSEHAKKEAAKPQAGKKVRRRSRRSKKKRDSGLQVLHEEADNGMKNKPPLETIESQETEDDFANDLICTGPQRWQKFLKFFKPSRLIS